MFCHNIVVRTLHERLRISFDRCGDPFQSRLRYLPLGLIPEDELWHSTSPDADRIRRESSATFESFLVYFSHCTY